MKSGQVFGSGWLSLGLGDLYFFFISFIYSTDMK
jgi:hypothetical protein